MGNEVKIIISAVDKASGTIRGMDASMKGFTAALGAVAGVAMAAGAALQKVINDTVDYGKQVGDMSRALGTSAEESSKLIQIADDLRIEVGTLKMGFKKALMEGVNPSIDGIKDLAKQYQALKTPVEKAQFSMKYFGRAGLELNKILELTPEKIDEMAQSAEDAGLVMSQEGVDATTQYWQELDNLNDRLEGLKTRLGLELLPVLNEFLSWLNGAIDSGDLLQAVVDRMTFKNLKEEAFAAKDEIDNNFIPAVEGAAGAIGELGEEGDTAATKIKGVVTALKEVDAAEMASRAMDGLNRAFEDGLISQGEYDALTMKIGVNMMGLSRQEVAQRQNLEYLTKAMNDGTMAGDDYADTVLYLAEAWNKVPKNVTTTYTVKYNKVGFGSEPGPGASVVIPGEDVERPNPNPKKPRAMGGPVVPGGSYLVGERGPELFVPNQSGNIIPNGAGGGIYIENMIINGAGQSPQVLAGMVAIELEKRTRYALRAGAGYAGY